MQRTLAFIAATAAAIILLLNLSSVLAWIIAVLAVAWVATVLRRTP